MSSKRKIQLVFLFFGSLLPAGTTLYRIPNVIDKHGSQQYRSLLASVEILFATAVANSLVLGSFVRDRGIKKQRWKFGSMSDSIERTTSRRGTVVRHWGSDEDLVRDLGLGVDPELRGAMPVAPRPAPMAVEGNYPVKVKDWQFPELSSETSEDIDLAKIKSGKSLSPSAVSNMTPRKVSFFDVGGLLGEDVHDRRVSSSRTIDTDGDSSGPDTLHLTMSSERGLFPPPVRRGSSALLQDIGGLFIPRSTPRTLSTLRGHELQTIVHEHPSPRPSSLNPFTNESYQSYDLDREQRRQQQAVEPPLHDVGGLLR